MNGSANAALPVPQFVSTPGTAATQDVAYTYEIETAASGESVTLALGSAPSGAALNGNTLTWTPSAAQSRISNSFSITATNSAGTATQNWSVTPAGTVRGSWIDTFWTSNGPVNVPFDWTAAPTPAKGFPMALVPHSDGTFQVLSGSGNSDGTFSIPNVPGGYYWLEPGVSAYWTSSSTVDLSEDVDAPPPSKVSTGSGSTVTTQMQFDFSGLAPIQIGDQLAFVWQLATPISMTWLTDTPVGATAIATSAQVTTNIDFSQGGQALFLQYEPEAIGTLSALELRSEDTLPNLTMTNGTSNSVSATLVQSPQTSFDLDVAGSQWAPLFSGVAPTTPTWLGADLAVTANMFMPQDKLATIQRSSIPLVADAQKESSFALGLLEGFAFKVCPGTSPAALGFSVVLPGEPPITTDQDFGLLQYSDPFSSNWQRVFTFCQTASVAIPLPNSSDTVSFNLVDSQSTSLPPAHIAPLIGQVQNPTINGKSLYEPATVGTTGVTLSWAAPTGTEPTGYKITEFAATILPNSVTTYLPREFLYTAKTPAVLPGLQAGETYVFVISSILDGAANFETQPNRSALPTASVSVISAPITIVSVQ